MLDVTGAVEVEVHRVGALAGQVLDRPDHVACGAGHAGREQPGARLAEGLLAALQVGRVGPDADRQRRGQPHLGRVAADDVLADPPEVGVPLAHVEAERAVELIGVPGRQRRGALGAGAADDDLWSGGPAGDTDAVLYLVELAVVAEPLPRWCVPDAGEDGELFFEPVEALAERGERNTKILVFALVPGGADAQFGPA